MLERARKRLNKRIMLKLECSIVQPGNLINELCRNSNAREYTEKFIFTFVQPTWKSTMEIKDVAYMHDLREVDHPAHVETSDAWQRPAS